MNYWDASAVVPLIVDEQHASQVAGADLEGPMVVWWGTAVEAMSAVARREREGILSADAAAQSLALLSELRASWTEVLPSEPLRRSAMRLLRVHALRAADGLQLAAALVAADGVPAALEFICHDARLAVAAAREGFSVTGPQVP